MKITDMNIDCLESCLEHLDMEELLNAAISNKRLNHAARYVFARMYGQKRVQISVINSTSFKRFSFMGKTLFISELKIGLQFLRCFGDLVSEMVIHFEIENYSKYLSNPIVVATLKQQRARDLDYWIHCIKYPEWEHLIVEYINEYCSESLTKIQFGNCPKGGLNNLTKAFNKVEKIEVEYSFPPGKRLHELFPKIRELKLCRLGLGLDESNDMLSHIEFIACNFPHLEHLEIDVYNMHEIYKENVAIALRLNPQLKSLKGNIWLDVILDTNFFWNANEILQNIETIDLKVESITHFKNNISDHIHLKNLKNLVIHLCLKDYSQPWFFPFTSDQLESLTFTGGDNMFYDLQFFNLIEKYPTLKKLSLSRQRNHMDYSKILKTLPLLEEICFNHRNNHMTADEILHLINEIQSLRALTFNNSISDRKLFEKGDLGNGWSVSYDIYQDNRMNTPYFIVKLKRQI